MKEKRCPPHQRAAPRLTQTGQSWTTSLTFPNALAWYSVNTGRATVLVALSNKLLSSPETSGLLPRYVRMSPDGRLSWWKESPSFPSATMWMDLRGTEGPSERSARSAAGAPGPNRKCGAGARRPGTSPCPGAQHARRGETMAGPRRVRT